MLKKVLILSVIFTVLLIFFSNCSKNPVSNESPQKTARLYIAESDYMSGLLEWMDVGASAISSNNLAIYNDASLYSYKGYLYILEKYGADNIIKYDPKKEGQNAILYQVHLEDNCNPMDIEFVNETKSYISYSNVPKIAVFNPSSSQIESYIDISSYIYNPDSNISPYAGDMLIAGNYLYVLLQRRDGYMPGASTLILKIDISNNQIIDTISLKYKNGYSMAYYNGFIFVSNPGSMFYKGDGAIEKINLSDKSVTTLIDESTLGGNPNQIVSKGNGNFYLTLYKGWKDVAVIEINEQGQILETLPNVKDAFGGIYYDSIDSLLYVGERDSVEMGIRIFKNNQTVGNSIKSNKSLPPTSLIVVR
jgi:hypothetical protein